MTPTLIAVFIGSALLILLLGIPMARGKVPPNGLYGVRLPVTMNNRAAWDAANEHFGWWMIVSGLLSLGAFFLGSFLGWGVDSIATVYVIVMMLPLAFGAITSIMAAYRAESESKSKGVGGDSDLDASL
ncbi:MAG TPA: hypothetical protein DCX60_02805 [Phycisphaerales bacterium]|nr:hypothetical protein [Phycisphaerales bacterium]